MCYACSYNSNGTNFKIAEKTYVHDPNCLTVSNSTSRTECDVGCFETYRDYEIERGETKCNFQRKEKGYSRLSQVRPKKAESTIEHSKKV